MRNVEFKDLLFIIVFATLIFFGALFIFISLKAPSATKQVSVRALETNINQKVNKKIQKLQSRDLMLRSKIKNYGKVSETQLRNESVEEDDSKYKIDIFDARDTSMEEKVPQTASEKVMALLSGEENFESDQTDRIEEYKQEMIQKARDAGWLIEISDDLEVTSVKKL